MNCLVVSVAAAILVSALAPLAPPSPFTAPLQAAALADSEPEAVIRAIYGAYGPDSVPENPEEKYFSPLLLKLWTEVDEGSKGAVEYSLDFDPFIDAQDYDTVSDVKTTLTEAGPAKARVNVTFAAFGEEKAAIYDFVSTDAGWKIDNIGWGGDRLDLRTLLDGLRKDQRKSR